MKKNSNIIDINEYRETRKKPIYRINKITEQEEREDTLNLFIKVINTIRKESYS